MNLFTYRNVVTGRIFALLAAVSMIMSTLPVSFLIAEASTPAPTPVTLFSDDFESGLGAWSTTGTWAIVGPGGGSAGSKVRAIGPASSGLMKVDVSTVGYEDIRVSFGYRGNLNGTDAMNVTYVISPTSTIGAGVFNASNAGDSTWHTTNMALISAADNNPNFALKFTGIFSAVSDKFDVDTVVITGTPIAPPACTPQYDVVGPTDVQNTDTSEYFNSIQDAIDDCDTVDGNIILLSGDVTTSEQVTVNKEITLDGGGNTLFSNFAKTTNSNNSAIGIGSDNVTIKNLDIDGSGGTNLHGINVYESVGVSIENVSMSDINRSGIVVNGSTVAVSNLTTTGSGWNAINVAQGVGVTNPSILNISNISSHDEAAQIWIDDISQNVTVNDIDNQYEIVYEGPHPHQDSIARNYTLKIPGDANSSTACVVEIVSDGSDFVVETNADAQPLSFIHNAWTAVINGASWIWGDDPIVDTSVDVTQTFVKNFGFVGNVTSATLEVASDNSNTVDFNGSNVATVTDLQNFQLATQDSYDVTSLVQQGNNELQIAVTNKGVNGSSARSNPAGLLYKLTIEGTETDVAGCAIPYEEPTYVIDGYKWSDTNGNGQWDDSSNEQGLAEWKIALRPMAMEPVEEVFVPADESVVTTATSLIAGHTYIVEASGTYTFGNRPDFVADAEWTHRTDAFQDSPLLPHGWTLGENTYAPTYNAAGLDLQIDNQNIDWGAFNNAHLYKTMIEGDGTALDLFIYDSYYGDNTGGIDVAIYDVTDYVTYTDNSGYYSFDVPAGEYQIVEEMVNGWTQTYPAGPSYYHVTAPAENNGYDFGNYSDAPESSLIITAPATDNEILASAMYTFEAEYVDADTIQDPMRWAIRPGCTSSVNLAGNVGGLSDSSTYDGAHFEADVDMSTWAAGDYCFIVNPAESGGAADLREVRPFTIEDTTPPLACVAGVNLLANPSFEEPIVTTSRLWDNLPAVGWTVKAMSNSATVGMEIQRGVFGWLPSDGDQITELDTDQNVRIKQVIDTIPGETYTLSWDYSARPNTSAPDSKMAVKVNGVRIATNNEDGSAYTNTNWISEEYTFVADSAQTEIKFIGRGSSNGLGALLDNTSLTCVPAEPEIPYGPYCGDGVINQEWEQNEVGDDGYNGTCQPEVPTQCTDLRLVKINLDAHDSVSFDNRIYLGNASNPIPNGVWFNFDDLGDDTVNDIATVDNGLAVSRDLINERLILGYRGGNDSRQIDIASGNIETMGIMFGAVDRNPIVGWPLEDGTGGSFLDVFQKNGDSTAIDFDLRADTGRDAVAVDINAGEPYNCPIFDPTYEVSGMKWNDENGDGERGENESGIPGWTIEITDGDTILSTTTDENGQYSFNVPVGFWAVSEVMQEGWNQTGLISSGRYGYADGYVYDGSENPSSPTSGSCEFNVGGYVPEATVTRSSSIAPESPYNCDFGNQQTPDTTPEVVIDHTIEHNYGTRFSRGPVGQVLGVSTTAGQCGIYLNDFMKEGMPNNPVEVYRLQAFLVGQGMDVEMTGVFDDTTDAAVRAFQLKYQSDILTPWYTAGVATNDNPTGYVYLTTKWKINDIMCPEIAPFPNLFVE